MSIERIDPEDCGCMDCGTGYSLPINLASQQDLGRCYEGIIENASKRNLKRIIVMEYD